MALADLLLRRPPCLSQAEAEPRLGSGITVYWRRGCPFCQRLRWALRTRTTDVRWVDIWSDPHAAAYVRSTNEGGFETVPTVVIDGVAHTNPSPKLVLDALNG